MHDQSSVCCDHDAEEWRAVPGYEGRYEVSNLGRVRSLWERAYTYDRARAQPLLLTPTLTRAGYLVVDLAGRSFRVHRLVLAAFVGPCPDGFVAGHLNGSRTDNRRANLAWITPAENQEHRFLHGTARTGDESFARRHPERLARGDRSGARLHPETRPQGERHPQAKLTVAQVEALRAERRSGTPFKPLAARYGISTSQAHRICSNKSWRGG